LNNSPTWGRHPDRLREAIRALNRTFYLTVGGGIILFLGSSAIINVLTHGMDRRASDIVTGISRLFAGVIFMLLSFYVPQWMGCYFSVVDTYKTRLAMYRTTREIWFCFSWTLWKHLVRMYDEFDRRMGDLLIHSNILCRAPCSSLISTSPAAPNHSRFSLELLVRYKL
jgi:hypothetical protein